MNTNDWEYKEVREIDRGPILNWFADRLLDFANWLLRKVSPYAKTVVIVIPFDED
jgi:hypothetical protein